MRFGYSAEQRDFAKALDAVLYAADVPSVARAWAGGDTSPGFAVWSQLAQSGVAGLQIHERHGGLGASAVDATVAFERLGFHGVPGPWVETAVVAPAIFGAMGDPLGLLPSTAEGRTIVTLAVPPLAPHAVDAEIATHSYIVDRGDVFEAAVTASFASVDPTRRPARPSAAACGPSRSACGAPGRPRSPRFAVARV